MAQNSVLRDDVKCALKFGGDVSHIIAEAAAGLAVGQLISSASYDSADGLHAIELMDPKLDPGSIPNREPVVQEWLVDGRLPLSTLSAADILSIFENILILESSWMNGNSFNQTLSTNLYLHPVAISAMRQILQLPTYSTVLDSSVPDLSITNIAYLTQRVNGTPPSAPAIDAGSAVSLPSDLKTVEIGSEQHTLLSALLAFVTLTLKSAEYRHRAVMYADFFNEEDYYSLWHGVDLAFSVPLEEALQQAANADTALQSHSTSAHTTAATATGAAHTSGKQLSPASYTWVAANKTPVAANALERISRLLRFRIAYTTATALLSPTHAIRTPQLQWGCQYAVADVDKFVRAAYYQLESYGAALSKPQTFGICAQYATTFFSSTPPRFVPLPTSEAAIVSWKQHLCDTVLAVAAPAIASHNPWRPYCPTETKGSPSVRALTGKEISAAPTALAEIFAVFNVRTTADAAGEARMVSAPVVPATEPYSTLAASTIPFAPTQLPPPIAPSGIVDAPLVILSAEDKAISPEAPFAKVSTRVVPSKSDARQHVSLHALLKYLFMFSRRSADVIVRSWLASIVIESPPPQCSAGLPDFEDYGTISSRSGILFGTHTLVEVIRSSLVDTGCTAELMASAECRKYVALLDQPLQVLIKLLFSSRLRIRRKLDSQLRDWALLIQESENIDALYAAYMDIRVAEADKAWMQKRGLHSEESVPADIDAEEHRHLHILGAAASTTRTMFWTMDIAVRLMVLHLEIGFESQLYHVDELAAAYWYMDHLLSIVSRQQRCMEYASATVGHFAELRIVTAETSRKGLTGGCQQLLRLATAAGVGAAASPDPAAPSAVADAKTASKGSKKDKAKKKPVSEEKLRQQLQDEVTHWVDHIVRFMRATQMISSSYSVERDTISAKSFICKALVRLLAAFAATGHWRGLPPTDSKPEHKFFRMSEKAFEHRFRDFACFAVPAPLTYRDYVEAFSLEQPTLVAVRNLLVDASTQLHHAIVCCKRAINGYRDIKTLRFGSLYDEFVREKTTKESKEASQKEKLRMLVEERFAYVSLEEIMPLQEPVPASTYTSLSSALETAQLLQLVRVATTTDSFVGRMLKEPTALERLPREVNDAYVAPSLLPPTSRLVAEASPHPSFLLFRLPTTA